MILLVTFLRDGVVVTEFLTLLTVDKGDPGSLHGLLTGYLESVNVELSNIAGFSTDGAISHLVSTHCIAHRLKAMMATADWPRSYPNLVRLWVAVAVLPISTVECERGFSRQNIIKSWQRTGLHNAKLGDLMTLSLLEYDVEWRDVVELWRSTKKRCPTKRKGTPVDATKKRGGGDDGGMAKAMAVTCSRRRPTMAAMTQKML
ncbi:unnamed protein product [Closterium sp. NIES-54]